MKDSARIEAAYDRLDLLLERERASAQAQQIVRLETEQVWNDQAYFLLCWGQLEIERSQDCRSAIRGRIAHSDWQVRRSWYLYDPEDKRLSGLKFEERAALVMDRGAGKGSAWAKTMFHYTARNEIAHGNLRSTRIDVSTFVQDCYVIQSALHRAM